MKKQEYVLRRILHFIFCLGIPFLAIMIIALKMEIDLNIINQLVFYTFLCWFLMGFPLFFTITKHELDRKIKEKGDNKANPLIISYRSKGLTPRKIKNIIFVCSLLLIIGLFLCIYFSNNPEVYYSIHK